MMTGTSMTLRALRGFTISLLLLGASFPVSAQEDESGWPRRVLVTNDNGIEDPKLVELARAFAPIAETVVAAPREDRSGSTHYAAALRAGTIEVEERDLGEGIQAYAIDGFPADAVLWALGAVMRDRPPDLVVSGINGGPNLAHDWIGSGTIGAARIAAYAGIPALAVSGVEDESPGSAELAAAVEWVTRLARSEFVRNLAPGQYLTVSFPGLPPSRIRGVRVARRAGLLLDLTFDRKSGGGSGDVWDLKIEPRFGEAAADSDVALHREGYVVVVPMRADEHDDDLLRRLAGDPGSLPRIRPSPSTDSELNPSSAFDVRFMQSMITHHAQALAMTDLVAGRDASEDVRRLAGRIDVSQRDEIAVMRRWLERRGESVPEAHGHDPLMPGMLTGDEMAELAAATGARFDRLFLESMIRHHEGALVMVADLFDRGGEMGPEIFQFASHVDADQRAEIERMRGVLNTLSEESTE